MADPEHERAEAELLAYEEQQEAAGGENAGNDNGDPPAEVAATPEQLKAELELQRAANEILQKDLQIAQLKAEVAEEKARANAAEATAAKAAPPASAKLNMPALESFTGAGTGRKALWPKWIAHAERCFCAGKVDEADYAPLVQSLIVGEAEAYATSNKLLEKGISYDVLKQGMAAGPWRANMTNFSSVTPFVDGSLKKKAPLDTVKALEEARAASAIQIPDLFMVFFLLFNLANDFRASLLINPATGKEWTDYSSLRQLVVSKAAADKAAGQSSSGGGGGGRGGHGGGSSSGGHGGSRSNTPSKQRNGAGPSGSNGAGPSGSNVSGSKRAIPPGGCFGCGSTEHRIGDTKPDGSHVCPKYDASRAQQRSKSPGNKRFANGKK